MGLNPQVGEPEGDWDRTSDRNSHNSYCYVASARDGKTLLQDRSPITRPCYPIHKFSKGQFGEWDPEPFGEWVPERFLERVRGWVLALEQELAPERRAVESRAVALERVGQALLVCKS